MVRMPWRERAEPFDGRARLLAVLGLPNPHQPPSAPPASDPPPSAEPGAPPLVDPGRHGAAALVFVAVASAVLSGFVVWRARPVPIAVAPPVSSAASASASAEIVVDVAGSVRRPGLVRLPLGSRVDDAIRAAGGLLPGATSAGLNLARKLSDGEQVAVAVPGANPGAGGSSTPGLAAAAPGKLDLNAASAVQLEELPGVGPVLAERIVQWRLDHGRFASVEQLREVPGIGDRKFESIRELVTV